MEQKSGMIRTAGKVD